MTETKTIFESIWNADEWNCTEEKWTDGTVRMKFVTDDASYTMMLCQVEPDFGWTVKLIENVRNDTGERIYRVLEHNGTFHSYQYAQDYVAELTEKYP